MSETIPCTTGENYCLYNGDCVQVSSQLPDDSVDFMVFSPPFANLYIYSDDIRDMGNCKGMDEFFEQYGYLSEQLWRILRPGRLMAVHCKNIVRYKGRDGVSGWTDFRGELIRHYEKYGFTYHSEVVIWTDPVLEMQKTKTQRLLYCQLRRDASHTGIGMPEYLLIFRKWDESKEDQEVPIRHFANETEQKKAGGGGRTNHAPGNLAEVRFPGLVRHQTDRRSERKTGPRRSGRETHLPSAADGH